MIPVAMLDFIHGLTALIASLIQKPYRTVAAAIDVLYTLYQFIDYLFTFDFLLKDLATYYIVRVVSYFIIAKLLSV